METTKLVFWFKKSLPEKAYGDLDAKGYFSVYIVSPATVAMVTHPPL
tara:strand:- start:728 stop:868 length:141 start_codon:yes stop_codon:yes gene_type:complete